MAEGGDIDDVTGRFSRLTFKKDVVQIFVEKFWKSGLHGAKWPMKEAYCVCLYKKDGKEQPLLIEKNQSGGQHVERVVLSKLKDYSNVSQIIMYLSYSPCHECCDEILEFKTEHPRCEITIIFPRLYFIRRECCSFCKDVDPEKHRQNMIGLGKLLQEDGIELEPFDWEHWQNLKGILNTTADDNRSRYTEARITYKMADYEKEEYKNSRRQEDENLLGDWGTIQQEARQMAAAEQAEQQRQQQAEQQRQQQ